LKSRPGVIAAETPPPGTISTYTPVPLPTETETPTPTVTPEPTKTPTPTVAPTLTPKPTETPKPQGGGEMVATGNVDVYLSPDGKKVGYLVPGQRFTFTGEEKGEWKKINAGGDILWIKGGSYGPVGKVEAPTPGEKCEVNCEAYSDLNLYRSPADKEPFSRLVPGTNKVFVVKNRSGDWMLIEVTEPNGAKWQAWAKDAPGTYGPVGKVTPVPPVSSACPPLPEGIKRYPMGDRYGFEEKLNIFAFAPDERLFFAGETENLSRAAADIIDVDLVKETVTFETVSGRYTLKYYSSRTRFAIFDMNKWEWIPTAPCNVLKKRTRVEVYVKDLNTPSAWITGMWQ